MINSRWYREYVAEHERELGKPQAFPLTGDADFTRDLFCEQFSLMPETHKAARLAESRYLGWYAAKEARQMTSADLIRAAGEALYGPRYESELALALDVNRRTVRRWKSGQDEPQPGVWSDLLVLINERAGKVEHLVDEIAKRIP